MAELRLDGQVAIVTGAGRGLGRAHAHLLGARGAMVVVNDPGTSLEGDGSNRTFAQAVVDEITAAGGKAVANFDSVATETGAAGIAAQAKSAFGRIDIVVNNAGNFVPDWKFLETSTETFASVWQVHVMGSINVIRAVWPDMLAQKYGRIINTTSHVGYIGSPNRLEYATAKMGLHGLTRALGVQGAPLGIHVNAIAPGGLTRPVLELPGVAEMIPKGAFEPDLVPPTMLWLAHRDCPVSGEIFAVMSGTTTRIRIAETRGFRSAAPTPEAIRDHFDSIMDEETCARSGLTFGTNAEARGMELMALYNT